ncbi:MAG: hypothetical protein ICV63_21775 [Coleofasciculus sp. Co-bin14]|nr:hypothetical protein [Coleofasciculus sp. Co-bin14]
MDKSWLATYLSAGLTTLSLVQNRTPFCQVQPIPPGHYLHISSGKPRCKRYWYGSQEYKSFSEAAEQLREQLLTAVEGRVCLYSNITSDLSGGFDSTTLALIAAKTLAKRGEKLHTITDKTVSATQSSDVELAQHAASLYSNITAVMIEGHEIPAEYSNLESVPLTDSPDLGCNVIGKISHRLEIIKSKGSQLHMSGEGGDAVLLAPDSYCADLLRRGRFVTFFQHINGWSRIGTTSSLALINSAVRLSFTSYRQWLFQQTKKLMAGDLTLQPLRLQMPIGQLMGWDDLPEFASWHSKKSVDLVLEELQRWTKLATPLHDLPGEHLAIAIIQLNGLAAKVCQQIADIYGVNLEFPYLDTVVIDACLSARPEERTSPFVYKPLLPRALHRDLPQSVFARHTKGDYLTDEFIGLRENRAAIEEIFQTSLLADIGLIDIRKLQETMQNFYMGFGTGLPLFCQTLALELWLRRLVQADRSFWVQGDDSPGIEVKKIQLNTKVTF